MGVKWCDIEYLDNYPSLVKGESSFNLHLTIFVLFSTTVTKIKVEYTIFIPFCILHVKTCNANNKKKKDIYNYIRKNKDICTYIN